MANLFRNDHQSAPESQTRLSSYNAARNNLLLVAVFTAINILLLVTNCFTYFLFSASVPYILVNEAMYACGMYPEEYYLGGYGAYEFFDISFFIIALIIAVLIIGLLLLFYFLSKRIRTGWLIAALVLFSADTVAMFLYYGLDMSMIIDILFHIFVIGSLSWGIYSGFKLKAIQKSEEPITVGEEAEGFEADLTRPDSSMIRPADMNVKSKVFLEAEVFGHKIIYRRVKRTNELVINGRVYAEYVALVEMPHMLTANIDGHAIAVGIGADSMSYITVDGKTVATKVRII